MADFRYAEAGEIAAPIEKVFDYRLDYTNLPEYNPNVANVRREDGGSEPGVGAHYVFDLSLPGMGTVEAFLKVLEVERPARIAQDTGSGGMAVRELCTFEETRGGARVEFEVRMDLPDEVGEADRSALEARGREQLRLELDLMKKILEGA